MRPIERKILNKISDKGMSRDDILEILDRTSKQEMKKSFPDDCHFQTDKYFAKVIMDALLRSGLVKLENNKLFKKEKGSGDRKQVTE